MSDPGPERQVQIGDVGRLREARVGDDHEDAVGVGELPLLDALPDDGVAVGRIGADQEEAVGELEVGVGRRRAVGAQRARVADGRRGHAQARVGVEVVGAEEALGELGCHVVLLGEELAGAVEGDGVGPVGGDDLAQARGRGAEGRLPRHPRELGAAVRAELRVEQPVLGTEHGRQVNRLGADVAEVGRMLGITLHPAHHALGHLDEEPAADAAVGAESPMPRARLRHGRASRAPSRLGAVAGAGWLAHSSRKFRIESRSQK